MSTQYTIKRGVERKIIENFITSNNAINWIANIGKTIKKDRSGVEKIVKNLANKSILERIDCPDELFKRLREEREKGGAFPSDCYLLNYDMNPEWFVEIAKPHLDNSDRKKILKFMNSDIASKMIRNKKVIDWIIKNKIGFNLEKEKEALPFIFISFPSTLRWVLYGDLSIIQKINQDKKFQKGIFLSFLNNKIIEDLLNTTYMHHEYLTGMDCSFSTKFYIPNLPESKKGEKTPNQGEIAGRFGIKFENEKIQRG